MVVAVDDEQYVVLQPWWGNLWGVTVAAHRIRLPGLSDYPCPYVI